MSTADLPLDSDPEWLGCEAMLSIPGFALLGSLAAVMRPDSGEPGGSEPPGSPDPSADVQTDPISGA